MGMEWITVALLFCGICGLSISLLLKFRAGRIFLCALMVVLLLPIVYVCVELILFYTVGRTMVPQVGVFCGVFVPPPTYFKPLVSMLIDPDVLVYEGQFICRHFGRHSLNMEMDMGAVIHKATVNVDFEMKYMVMDGKDNVLISGIANQGPQGQKSVYWPYVYCAKFNVPSQLPRNEGLKIRIETSEGLRGFLKTTPCSRFVVMKVSDE